MLKTNSMPVRAAIRQYIINNYDPTGYDLPAADTFDDVAVNIMKVFRIEKQYSQTGSELQTFKDWCFGLPSILCCDFLLGDTCGFVAVFLKQTPQQAAKYTNEQASDLMISLIYNELCKSEQKFKQKTT